MDKNQATGLILISIMLLLYFSFFGNQPELPATEDVITEQAEQPQDTNRPSASPEINQPVQQETSISAGIEPPSQAQDSIPTPQASEELFEIENKNLKLTFSTLGGRIKEVLIKDYLTYTKEPLILLDENSSRQALLANNAGKQIDLMQQSYEVDKSTVGDTTIITFTLANGSGGRFI
jgi:YidC/Oxa1 family membrane protein insertase